jgi:hypothetical protein
MSLIERVQAGMRRARLEGEYRPASAQRQSLRVGLAVPMTAALVIGALSLLLPQEFGASRMCRGHTGCGAD